MKKIVLALLGALVFGPAAAQTPDVAIAPLGYCQLATLTSAVGLASCSGGIPATANAVYLQAEGQIVRYRDDGVAPSATVGMPVAAAATLMYRGRLSALLFIEATASAKLNVLFYRTP